MRRRSGILSPRRDPAALDDLAERASFIGRQRVRGRRTLRAARRARGVAGWLALAVILVVSQAAVVRWLLTSPRFAVAHVEVRGLRALGEAEVRAAAGVRAGENLFRLDPEAVAVRLKGLVRIKRADVIRHLPNRVTLLIQERRPFALAVRAGRLYWLDEEGHGLGPEPRAVASELPLITGLGSEEPAGGSVGGVDRTRSAVALVRTILRTARPLARKLSEIDAGPSDGPILYTVEGVEVRLGADGWEERLGRLEGVLAQLQADGEAVASIDLRFRDQVVLKPRR